MRLSFLLLDLHKGTLLKYCFKGKMLFSLGYFQKALVKENLKYKYIYVTVGSVDKRHLKYKHVFLDQLLLKF